jgi:V8-like Glu-specific endopeptidase
MSYVNGINKSLYTNIDPRMNLYELDKLEASEKQELYPDLTRIKTNAMATACLIHEKMLIENEARDSYIISTTTAKTLADSLKNKYKCPLQEGEKFGDEFCISLGTGFLVSRSKLMTAGHCVSSDNSTLLNLDAIRVVFNLCMEDSTSFRNKIAKTEVYRIKRVIHHQYDSSDKMFPDWALLKLDRSVVGIEPLKMQYEVLKDMRVYMLGYPMGLPLKFSGLAYVKKTTDTHKIGCNVPAFIGNSGSPVIARDTGAVVAMLVNGKKDYTIDEEHKRNTGESRVVSYRVPEKEIASTEYELCQKITPEMLDPHQMIAKKGRAKRKVLSNRNSEEFERDENRKLNLSTYGLFSAYSLPFVFIDILSAGQISRALVKVIGEVSSSLHAYKEVIRIYPGVINLLEAKKITDLQKHADWVNFTSKDKLALVQNMSAFNLSPQSAFSLHVLETHFRYRFSPDKILDLLRYESDQKINFEFAEKKRILKCLQQNDPENLSVDSNLADRREAVIEAVSRVKKN